MGREVGVGVLAASKTNAGDVQQLRRDGRWREGIGVSDSRNVILRVLFWSRHDGRFGCGPGCRERKKKNLAKRAFAVQFVGVARSKPKVTIKLELRIKVGPTSFSTLWPNTGTYLLRESFFLTFDRT